MIWDLPCSGFCEQCDMSSEDCPIQTEAANAVADSTRDIVGRKYTIDCGAKYGHIRKE